MDDKNIIIDDSVKSDLLRYPMVDLIRLLFPGHPVRRGVMCCPFRQDKNPSFSCFRGKNGVSLGKDHSTGVTYDNIMLYRTVYPDYNYVEAIDALSKLILGRSAFVGERTFSYQNSRRTSVIHHNQVLKEDVLKVVSEVPLSDVSVPDDIKRYWRGRGISDAVINANCSYVVIENSKRKGNHMIDPQSRLPIVDSEGNVITDDGLIRAIGQRNDIGGMVFRVPDTADRKGFKGATSSFITTFLADGSRPKKSVLFFGEGEGDNSVHFLRYVPETASIYINNSQGFTGINPSVAVYAMTFMDGFSGVLDEREIKCACAVLSSLNAPISREAVFVEGMFDGLSDREFNSYKGNLRKDYDLIILNSITNIKWAVPFLARHNHVISLMDNDLNSHAGQKAFRQISEEVRLFCKRVNSRCIVHNGSDFFRGYKDLNEALMAAKGFPEKRQNDNRQQKSFKNSR